MDLEFGLRVGRACRYREAYLVCSDENSLLCYRQAACTGRKYASNQLFREPGTAKESSGGHLAGAYERNISCARALWADSTCTKIRRSIGAEMQKQTALGITLLLLAVASCALAATDVIVERGVAA